MGGLWTSLVAQVKNLPASAGAVFLIPGSGRSPGEGNGNPFQYSCLEDAMDRDAWRTTVRGLQRVGHDWAAEHTHMQTHVHDVYHMVNCQQEDTVWVPFTLSVSFWSDTVFPSYLGLFLSPNPLDCGYKVHAQFKQLCYNLCSLSGSSPS